MTHRRLHGDGRHCARRSSSLVALSEQAIERTSRTVIPVRRRRGRRSNYGSLVHRTRTARGCCIVLVIQVCQVSSAQRVNRSPQWDVRPRFFSYLGLSRVQQRSAALVERLVCAQMHRVYGSSAIRMADSRGRSRRSLLKSLTEARMGRMDWMARIGRGHSYTHSHEFAARRVRQALQRGPALVVNEWALQGSPV